MKDVLQQARECGAYTSDASVTPAFPRERVTFPTAAELSAFRDSVLEEAAKKCDEQAAEWDSDAVVTEKNYAAASGAAIRSMKGKP